MDLRQVHQQKVEKLRLLEEKDAIKRGLPHLHAFKWYKWARIYYESTNHVNLLCAANQISKSSTQIRKVVDWSTDKAKWPVLWPNLTPNLFWYFYPDQGTVNDEVDTKWSQFLPRNGYKKSHHYGWEFVKKKGDYLGIKFSSGIYTRFKTYGQRSTSHQAASVFALFADEEMPIDHWPEIQQRMSATDGYFHMCFTSTLGQDFWRRALEPTKNEKEELPNALKMQISKYDCMYYEDGTPSMWTKEKIDRDIALCPTEAEVQRRVMGRFVVSGGRMYPQFEIKKHYRPGGEIPKDWQIYGAVDTGSGGKKGHPTAITFIAVRPDMRRGRLVAGHRMDGIPTTSSDILKEYIRIKNLNGFDPISQVYDHANKDFHMVAERAGLSFDKADKARDAGIGTVNTLLKNDMLTIDSDKDEDLSKASTEYSTLREDTPKTKAKDDYTDSVRYNCQQIFWDWSFITGQPVENAKENKEKFELEEKLKDPTFRNLYERRKQGMATMGMSEAEEYSIEDEIEEHNELSDPDF